MSPYGGGVVGIIIPPYPVLEMAGMTNAGEAIESRAAKSPTNSPCMVPSNYIALHSIWLIYLITWTELLVYIIALFIELPTFMSGWDFSVCR